MVKLDYTEKQIVAVALLAMFAECPEEDRAANVPLFQSITLKLGLAETFVALQQSVKVAQAGSGGGKAD